MKAAIQELETKEQALEPQIRELLLQVPLPPDADVPVGAGSEGNVEIKRWHPPKSDLLPNGFDTTKSFEQNKGFKPKNHIDLVRDLKLCDFERGVKIAGTLVHLDGHGYAACTLLCSDTRTHDQAWVHADERADVGA